MALWPKPSGRRRIPAPDIPAVRQYRLGRIRAELKRGLCRDPLYDPLNIRYATDSTDMQLWVMHNAMRYGFVAAEGPVILLDFHMRASVRPLRCDRRDPPGSIMDYLWRRTQRRAGKRWAGGIADLVELPGGGNRRLAIDHFNPEGVAELARLGISVHYGEEVMENARLMKWPDELMAMRRAIAACEASMAEMQAALSPALPRTNSGPICTRQHRARRRVDRDAAAFLGGPRTNPWFQECSSRVIEAGDLVAFDTDLIGPYGYCADISRTWLCGDGRRPTNSATFTPWPRTDRAQHRLTAARHCLPRACRASAVPPPDCYPNRYGVLFHGVGLGRRIPGLPHASDWTVETPDGVLEPGMVVCVESYIGRLGGREGVKLEEQVLITETGEETLSNYPLALTR